MAESARSEIVDERVRRLDALVLRVQQAVLGGFEEILERRLTPFLDKARETIVATVEEVIVKHAGTVTGQVKSIVLDIVEEVLKKQLDPLFLRGKQVLLEGLQNATVAQKYIDLLMSGMKKLTREAVVEVFQVQVPEYSRRAGFRVMDYAVAGTLYCLAAVFLLMGAVLGLREAGLPAFLSYFVVGGAAAVGGFCLLKLRARAEASRSAPPADPP